MTTGHFAGNFAEAFARIAMGREDNKRRDKIAKLQGQLLEETLKARQGQNQAFENLQQQATGSLGEIEGIGGGETVNGRRKPDLKFTGQNPKSLLEILADPEGQIAAFRAGIISPAELLAEQRLSRGLDLQEGLLSQVGNLTAGGGDLIPSGLTIDAQGRPTFSFARNPDAVTPITAELEANAFDQLLGDVKDVLTFGQQIEGTTLELGGFDPAKIRTGSGFLSGVKSFFGFERGEDKRLHSAYDKVQKALGRLQVSSPAFRDATTDVGRRAALAALPEEKKTLEANASVMATEIKDRLAQYKDRGIAISPESMASAQQLIAELENLATLTVEQVRALTPNDIRDLDIETVKQWPKELQRALEQRLDELDANP